MSNNERVRIGLCADTHFWPTNTLFSGSHGSLQLQPWSEQLQNALLAELENAQLDYVIHLGDVTCGGGVYDMPPDEFYAALDRTQQAYRQLSARIYALPGNHDCPPGGGNWSYFEDLWALQPGMGEIIDTPMARLILLNTQGHSVEQIEAAKPTDPVYGWVGDSELARLEEALATAGSRPVLLFTHQLLHPWSADKPWEDFYEIRNATPVLDLLAQYGNVKAVFQAHAHRLDVQVLHVGDHPCHFIVIPAIIEYPLGWLYLELTPHTLQVALQRLPLPELADLGGYSGEGQFWRSGKPEWAELKIELV
ncbi:MAG: metallophosphoesterase [Chloroflexi bacterium]|nr:metallophosphoesterase [Chloroflexota bacterium]